MRQILFVLVLFLTGCTPQYTDFFPNYDDGSPKPTVVLLPMSCSSNEGVKEDIADAITHYTQETLKKRGRVFIPQEHTASIPLLDCFYENNTKLFQEFVPGECVVVTELVFYKKAPYRKPQEQLSDMPVKDAVTLSVGVRLKIVRVGSHDIQVLREELVRENIVVIEEAFEKGSRLYEEIVKAHQKVADILASTIERASRIKAVA